ncbi:hypothetical protein NDU88_000228 [Pleurodeles waltl]|uniref:Uncharacterized protein n=1 Tax=Pleurodeles waltl TaxID=8319 RepID=A0AAV7UPD5_PLEWA|nr:hypothetical protein NDU88_000228 [Pleurodeles waltl]
MLSTPKYEETHILCRQYTDRSNTTRRYVQATTFTSVYLFSCNPSNKEGLDQKQTTGKRRYTDSEFCIRGDPGWEKHNPGSGNHFAVMQSAHPGCVCFKDLKGMHEGPSDPYCCERRSRGRRRSR